jgi:DUF438 domain-containing protein
MLEGLTGEQVEGIMDALPMEILFVDENDKVRFWNKGDKRTGRTDILGKNIRGCHKTESISRLVQLISNLRSGAKDEEEFWVSYNERILNRFIAVRSKEGKYLGLIQYLFRFKDLEKLAEEKKEAYKLLP